MELLRRHEDDPAVARAQIVHFFAGLESAKLQHLLDDGFGSRVIRRELGIRLGLRRQRGAAQRCQQKGHSHPIASTTLGFSTVLWKSLWKFAPGTLKKHVVFMHLSHSAPTFSSGSHPTSKSLSYRRLRSIGEVFAKAIALEPDLLQGQAAPAQLTMRGIHCVTALQFGQVVEGQTTEIEGLRRGLIGDDSQPQHRGPVRLQQLL